MTSTTRRQGPVPPGSDVVDVVSWGAVSGVFTTYGWKNVAITLWFGPATVESVSTFEGGCKMRVEAFPRGLSSVHIMVPGARTMPTNEARTELMRVLREYAPYSAGVAVVIPGTGFWAGALRSLVTALSVVGRASIKPRIFGDVVAVSEWLPPVHAERTGVELDPQELLHALQQAQRACIESAA